MPPENLQEGRQKIGSISNRTPVYANLLAAGTAGCIADFLTFPFDTAKVRLQVAYTSPSLAPTGSGTLGAPGPRYKGTMGTIMTVAREEGFKSLYSGLTAGLQRQALFASIRIGCYDSIKTLYQSWFYGDTGSSDDVSIPIKACAALSTGVFAVLVAQPTEVVKVRFQAAYANGGSKYSTHDAYKGIAKNEGFLGLWRGKYLKMS
ncbi:hypothetical protein QYM36_014145 [Artemia franciscana]|uniref:Uncharacterized protein n=1 Tax=Artemia franciscana TaxID=6661 RepID=A0AA88L0N1_ARTSF|nr:hypothetical protein QYM36_014145 [Artemia franciscana]KAK2708431.1 hypothetical protein QYM36_014145 [Artemia franciscana]KAK2708433.1 hypothetical protein QYM36_014145 [Artemia franciscana]